MKKNFSKWQLLILFVVFLLSQNVYSQDDFNVTMPSGLLKVIDQIPSDFSKIDNITIRLLHSMTNPKEATACIEALPQLLKTSKLHEMDYYIKLYKISNLIRFFEDIFSPINMDEYYAICKPLKENEENHDYIYYLINTALRKSPASERGKRISQITELMPLRSGINTLIIDSLYNNFDEEQCSETIEQIKKKYTDNKPFIQEIEEAKERILYNRTHKDLHVQYTVSP